MWIFSEAGFYSVVEHKRKPGHVLIRTRVRKDLERLRGYGFPHLEIHNDKTWTFDYQYRAIMSKSNFARVMQLMAVGIDYVNFKNRIGERYGEDRASLYMKIWSELRTYLGRGWWYANAALAKWFADREAEERLDEGPEEEDSDFLDPVYDYERTVRLVGDHIAKNKEGK